MKITSLLLCSCALTLAGCFTCSEPQYPDVAVTPAPAGKKVSIRYPDFKLSVEKFQPVKGHESMIPGAEEEKNVLAGTYAADGKIRWGQQEKTSSRVISRGIAELKRKGYVFGSAHPDYVIRLSATGPIRPEYDVLKQAGVVLCSILTACWNEVTWKMTLKLTDASGQKVFFTKDYEQTYSVVVWGPLPILSPAFHDMVTEPAANSWALTAMADMALADATAYIAGQAK